MYAIHPEFVYTSNYYPQQHESGERQSDIKVWNRGHRESDPSQTGQLCTPVALA
jgi:hypothetical protein